MRYLGKITGSANMWIYSEKRQKAYNSWFWPSKAWDHQTGDHKLGHGKPIRNQTQNWTFEFDAWCWC